MVIKEPDFIDISQSNEWREKGECFDSPDPDYLHFLPSAEINRQNHVRIAERLIAKYCVNCEVKIDCYQSALAKPNEVVKGEIRGGEIIGYKRESRR